MGNFDLFPYVWLAIVGGGCVFSLVTALRSIRRGEARAHWLGGKNRIISKAEQPSYFRLIVGFDFARALVAGLMFWAGLGFLKW